LAAGSLTANYVKVWRYGDSKEWEALGQTLSRSFEDPSLDGFSIVSLNDDGNVLAVGAPYSDGEPLAGSSRGRVRVYIYVENVNSWIQIGSDIGGTAAGDFLGNAVSLSNTGTRLAVGAFQYDNPATGTNGGLTSIFEFQVAEDPIELEEGFGCGPSEMEFVVDLAFDAFPSDVSYSVLSGSGSALLHSSFDESWSGKNITQRYCLPSSDPLMRFQINDRYGDGLCCSHGNGGFQVSVDGEHFLNGSDFGASSQLCLAPSGADVQLLDVSYDAGVGCTCSSIGLYHFSEPGTPTVLWRNVVELDDPSNDGDTTRQRGTCVSDGCLAVSVNTPVTTQFTFEVSYKGNTIVDQQSPVDNVQTVWFGDECASVCPGKRLVQIALKTKGQGHIGTIDYANHFSLVGSTSGELWNLDSTEPFDVMNTIACAPSSECLTFQLAWDFLQEYNERAEDWDGHFSLWLDGELKKRMNSLLVYPQVHQFGNCESLTCEDGSSLLHLRVTTGDLENPAPIVIVSPPLIPGMPPPPPLEILYGVDGVVFWSLLSANGTEIFTHEYNINDQKKVFDYRFCLPSNESFLFASRDIPTMMTAEVEWDGSLIPQDPVSSFYPIGNLNCEEGYQPFNVVTFATDFPFLISWTLTSLRDGPLAEVSPFKPRSIHYHTSCVLIDDCSSFSFNPFGALEVEQEATVGVVIQDEGTPARPPSGDSLGGFVAWMGDWKIVGNTAAITRQELVGGNCNVFN